MNVVNLVVWKGYLRVERPFGAGFEFVEFTDSGVGGERHDEIPRLDQNAGGADCH